MPQAAAAGRTAARDRVRRRDFASSVAGRPLAGIAAGSVGWGDGCHPRRICARNRRGGAAGRTETLAGGVPAAGRGGRRWRAALSELRPARLVVACPAGHCVSRARAGRSAVPVGMRLRCRLRAGRVSAATRVDSGLSRVVVRAVAVAGPGRGIGAVRRARMRSDHGRGAAAGRAGLDGRRVPVTGVRAHVVAVRRLPVGKGCVQPAGWCFHVAGLAGRGAAGGDGGAGHRLRSGAASPSDATGRAATAGSSLGGARPGGAHSGRGGHRGVADGGHTAAGGFVDRRGGARQRPEHRPWSALRTRRAARQPSRREQATARRDPGGPGAATRPGDLAGDRHRVDRR